MPAADGVDRITATGAGFQSVSQVITAEDAVASLAREVEGADSVIVRNLLGEFSVFGHSCIQNLMAGKGQRKT
ncbi:MAG: hypothetical protein K2P70_20180 [Hyphomonadaceae bacterium]|nr:hypothetical protein [Hyphomonadaceae bacterium]